METDSSEVTIARAEPQDAEEILLLQRIAYKTEGDLYNDYTIPPLTQTLEEIRSDFTKQLYLKATVDNKIVGSVRGCENLGSCLVGRLIVHPEFRKRGIGTALMHEIERRFAAVARFELFTGHKSADNIRLYERLGYRSFRTRRVSDALELVYFEKFRGQAPSTSS